MKQTNNNPKQDCAHKWPVFFLVAAGVFLSTMDSSMVNVALPSIMRSFSTSLVQVQWVVLIYLLTITVTLLLWGIVADRSGKHIVYLAGVAIFMSGSIACSWAPALSLLIFFRFFEGLGAAMMMSAGPAIIRDVFPRHQIGQALGFIGIATSMGLMSGPVISGMVITSYSWRVIFLVTVPVSILVLGLGLFIFLKPGVVSLPGNNRLFDWKGIVLWALLIISFIFYAHFLPAISLIFKIVGFIGLVMLVTLFIWAEKTRRSTILPLHLFGKSYYIIGLITAAVSFGALFVVLILMPFYLDYIKELPAKTIGLVMMALPLTLFVVSPAAGMLYDRLGSKYLTTAGLGLCFLALLLLVGIDQNTDPVNISWRLAFLGMGQAMFLAPNTASLLSRINNDDVGVTSGLLATSRNLGMLAGAAFGGIVFAAWFSYFTAGAELRNYYPEQADFFMSALKATFICTAAISLLAAVISWQREK